MNWTRNTIGVRIVKRVMEFMEVNRDYLPFTLRQVHYQLVKDNTPGYANTANKYKQLSEWLYAARVDGLIPWENMTDRARPFQDLSGFLDSSEWRDYCLRYARHAYRRALMSTQDKQLEIWTEKDALAGILTKAARPYAVSVMVCRGFGSGSQFNDVMERADKPLHVLYFGDHDPSGMWITERDIRPRLAEKHGYELTLERVALNTGQVQDLVTDPQPPNPKDTRTPWYMERYGADCWELDALEPAELTAMVQQAIERNIDMELFEWEREREQEDFKRIDAMVDRWAQA